MDGALIIDKPAGITSHDVVARVRKIIGERRVGHTGTLDPFATGVLVVLVGRATRVAQFLSGAEKEYEAVIRLGYRTDTGDATGGRLGSDSHARALSTQSLRKKDVEAAMASLRGEIEQTPPMYSARKVGGRKLYELARRGEEIERAPVRIMISEFEAIEQGDASLKQNPDGTHDTRVHVVCSAGTYIRTLAEDFGKKLGLGAHLTELRRTRAGRFTIKAAITLDRLTELAESNSIADVLISSDAVLSHLPTMELNANEAARAVHGIDLEVNDSQAANWPDDQAVRLRSENRELIAVGTYDQGRRRIHPTVVIGNRK
jgi:tRNA pseudouridine55 synthase